MGKRYKNKLNNALKFILIIFVVLLIVSLGKIIIWYKSNEDNKKIYENISNTITINENNENEEDKYNVDFEVLKAQNSDTIAWIKINGTNIEYPVVKSINNDYYLNHNFEKKYNTAGWIFADYKNKFDGTDKNIVIYGHNRRDNLMFGSLKNILNDDWYNNRENLKIYFYTENENNIYEVFSVYQIKAEDYYIKTEFESDENFIEFVTTLQNRSKVDFGIQVTQEDTILTLSTCAESNEERIVLHARKTN